MDGEVREALSEPEEERMNSHTDSVGGCTGQQVLRPWAKMGLACLRTYRKASVAGLPCEGEWPELRSERSTGPYNKGCAMARGHLVTEQMSTEHP